jgi:hypothetical protein
MQKDWNGPANGGDPSARLSCLLLEMFPFFPSGARQIFLLLEQATLVYTGYRFPGRIPENQNLMPCAGKSMQTYGSSWKAGVFSRCHSSGFLSVCCKELLASCCGRCPLPSFFRRTVDEKMMFAITIRAKRRTDRRIK